MNSKLNSLKSNGVLFIKFNNENISYIKKIQEIIDTELKGYQKKISSKKILKIQEKINKKLNPKKFLQANNELFKKIFGKKKISVQYYFYLRAIKTKKKNEVDYNSINFHRESHNSKNNLLKKVFNLWIPVKNCYMENSIKYYPNSHKMKENVDFQIKNYNTKVKKHSTKHKLGFLYKEKKFIFKKNLKPKRLFKKNHFIIFSGELIHGAGDNNCKKTRFSLDARFILTKDLKSNMIQSATGRKYFINTKIS